MIFFPLLEMKALLECVIISLFIAKFSIVSRCHDVDRSSLFSRGPT